MSLRPNARTDARRNRYKVAVDATDGRRRREDNMIEIRKSKREESLQKKRREGLPSQEQLPTPYSIDKKVLLSFIFTLLFYPFSFLWCKLGFKKFQTVDLKFVFQSCLLIHVAKESPFNGCRRLL